MDQLQNVIPQNFQTYIQQATSLVKTAKTGMKLVKDLNIATAQSILTTAFASYLTPVFNLLGQYRQFIPISTSSLPGIGGIGGIGAPPTVNGVLGIVGGIFPGGSATGLSSI